MTQGVVEYFFTPVSPWTYLGHPRFAAIASIYGVTVQMKPCDLGKVFSVSGGLPLKDRARQRQDYRLIELARWSKYLGTALNLHPKHFPVNADAAALAIIGADVAYGTQAAMSLAFGLMRGCWSEERHIGDSATIDAIVREAALDPARLATPEVVAEARRRFEANTKEAIERGVFGAPWYVYAGESYWGQDRLDFLERAIVERNRR